VSLFQSEARVVVDGVTLTSGQVMSVRVAVTRWLHELAAQSPEERAALGPIRDGYIARLQEVEDMLCNRREVIR
jgi:ribosomal protein S28E/S33